MQDRKRRRMVGWLLRKLRLKLDEVAVLDAIEKLAPEARARVIERMAKQAVAGETGEGVHVIATLSYETTMAQGLSSSRPEGFRVSARGRKELRRFTGHKDPRMLEWFRRFEPGEVFYDIGANVGGYTLAAAAMHGDSVRIVAIEPSFSSFESLARNLSANGLLGLAIPLQIALLDGTALKPIYYNRSTAAGVSLHAVGTPLSALGERIVPVEVQMVPTYALDDIIAALDLPRPTRIKIDVDGYEEQVLRGATMTLTDGTVRDLFIEVVDHDGDGTRLKSVTGCLGRCGYYIGEILQHPPAPEVADYLFVRRAKPPNGHVEDVGDLKTVLHT